MYSTTATTGADTALDACVSSLAWIRVPGVRFSPGVKSALFVPPDAALVLFCSDFFTNTREASFKRFCWEPVPVVCGGAELSPYGLGSSQRCCVDSKGGTEANVVLFEAEVWEGTCEGTGAGCVPVLAFVRLISAGVSCPAVLL